MPLNDKNVFWYKFDVASVPSLLALPPLIVQLGPLVQSLSVAKSPLFTNSGPISLKSPLLTSSGPISSKLPFCISSAPNLPVPVSVSLPPNTTELLAVTSAPVPTAIPFLVFNSILFCSPTIKDLSTPCSILLSLPSNILCELLKEVRLLEP